MGVDLIRQAVSASFDDIISWLEQQKNHDGAVVYTSVDIRESSHKIASVDTNVFPAGFNNLDDPSRDRVSVALDAFIQRQYPNTTHIFLCCESHTRNPFYLDNIHRLSTILQQLGYAVTMGSFFTGDDGCHQYGYIDGVLSDNRTVRLYGVHHILAHPDRFDIDLCLLNNDLMDGRYDALTQLNVPIVPDPKMGWHRRKKSDHMVQLNQLTHAMVTDCGLSLDPWQLSTLFSPMPSVTIHHEPDRERLKDAASDLLKKINQKYQQHGIDSDPYLVLKSDNGTYGMGVIQLSDPNDIIRLNRKNRNKLQKGKASIPIQNMVIQEGVASVKVVDNNASEEVMYNVDGQTVGGFYRMHNAKSDRDILNSKGMQFQSLNAHKPGDVSWLGGVNPVSYVIAQLANLAAQRELMAL